MRLIRECAQVDLGNAKTMVETVLGGGEVRIDFTTKELANAFLAAAEQTGVEGRLENRQDTEDRDS